MRSSRTAVVPIVFAAALVLAPRATMAVQETPEPAEPQAAPDEWQESVGVHTVRRGDTLWDLAARFLSNPSRWTAIFELNPQVVEDPHWIYPGEELRIPGAAVARVDRVRVERGEDYLGNLDRPQEGARGRYPTESVFRQPRERGSGLSILSLDERPPLPAVSTDDFRRAPLLVPPGALGPEGVTVRVMEENPLDLGLPTAARQQVDVVVALGGLEPSIGDTLKAIRRVRAEEPHGDVIVPKALLEVDRLWADSARATVVQLYGDYEVGDAVVRLDTYDLDALWRLQPVDDGFEGAVIAFEMPQVLLGPGEFVFLDVGDEAGAKLGDEFAVFSRDERESIDLTPDDALSVLRVVHVAPGTSTARIVSVRDPGTRPGDPVRLIRRLSPPSTTPAG